MYNVYIHYIKCSIKEWNRRKLTKLVSFSQEFTQQKCVSIQKRRKLESRRRPAEFTSEKKAALVARPRTKPGERRGHVVWAGIYFRNESGRFLSLFPFFRSGEPARGLAFLPIQEIPSSVDLVPQFREIYHQPQQRTKIVYTYDTTNEPSLYWIISTELAIQNRSALQTALCHPTWHFLSPPQLYMKYKLWRV